jgi:DNA-binding transcriptional LysR family regulator
MSITVSHLRNFAAVAEELNFTCAAERLQIGQQGLSSSIRTLEREVGARLFERSTRHVRLTPEGRALLGPAQGSLAEL